MQTNITNIEQAARAMYDGRGGKFVEGRITCHVRLVYKHGEGGLVPQVNWKLDGKRISRAKLEEALK